MNSNHTEFLYMLYSFLSKTLTHTNFKLTTPTKKKKTSYQLQTSEQEFDIKEMFVNCNKNYK